ncbi:MAG: hypothetical protein PHV78_03490 [Patescibacteria group bacterium]|nr:hypothetical protein [Patescibacteria group bacterium]MDD5121549.1 hypothetical protein [Patescibacteria group bacterium]MDD5222063.1 hypothetical protein [Patescibacteria group bacterium]MDD5396287.1 hypothetical protein [Patescibacteria group bacterium]
MAYSKCKKCGMPLKNEEGAEDSCACNQDLCKYCCECNFGCQCGCKEESEGRNDTNESDDFQNNVE